MSSNISFSRALTSSEKESFKSITQKAKKELGVKNTRLIAFDFGMPADVKKNIDTGIGSTWSKSGEDYINFVSMIAGINSIQLGPQGNLTKKDKSPYASSNFALGEHIIDPIKLTKPGWGCILDEKTIRDISKEAVENPFYVHYDKVLGQDSQDGSQAKMLDVAYENFKQLDENHSLKHEFKEFKKENADWLDRFAVFELLCKINDGKNFSEWKNDEQRNLYSEKISQECRERVINNLYENPENIDFAEKKKFFQFVADKQQKEAKQKYNKDGITLAGDCLIGFSDQEKWAYIDLFDKDYTLGTHDYRNGKRGAHNWGLPALNFDRLLKEANGDDEEKPIHNLLEQKFDKFFERYDAIRLDAAWQYKNPMLIKKNVMISEPYPIGDNGKIQYKYDLGMTIFNILEKSAKKKYGENFDKENVIAELLGPDSKPTENFVLEKDLGYGLSHMTRWANDNWGTAKFYNNDPHYRQMNIELSIGNHDVPSVVDLGNQAIHEKNPDFSNQPELLERNLKLEEKIETVPQFIAAKFAELFLNKNQFYTYTDIMGLNERINEYWSPRVPKDYERFYYQQAQNGYAINLPDALGKAITAKRGKTAENSELLNKLKRAANILKSNGYMTTREANQHLGADYNEIEN